MLVVARENMEVSERIRCPYCGQWIELVVDTSTSSQRFTTDCEICCRPFEVIAECEPGEVLNLEVQGG
jgi:Cysteine-rich CPXCG